ncbi:MAG: hypothetical protein GJ680_08245 [Alteromonadaceae bacterium]|nr:hypothetical protein [Alteromonadaceae bacterium]
MTHTELMQKKVIQVLSDIDGNHRSAQGVESVTAELESLVEFYRQSKESMLQEMHDVTLNANH